MDLSRGVLVTGADGQLGSALCEEFQTETCVVPLTRAEWDVTLPPPAGLPEVDVVLHAAAWTEVDGAEASPQDAAAVNVGGTQHVLELRVPVVLFSTDYVFDGRKREPYVESDAPNPLSIYGRTKLQAEAVAGENAWIVRTSWLHGWTGTNFVRTMLDLGAERDEVAVVDDQRGSPTYVGHLAAARPGVARSSPRAVARRGWRRLHVGRLRCGDLRDRRNRLSRQADHHRRTRPSSAEARVLGAEERPARCADAAALARRPADLPGEADGLIRVGRASRSRSTVELDLDACRRADGLPTVYRSCTLRNNR